MLPGFAAAKCFCPNKVPPSRWGLNRPRQFVLAKHGEGLKAFDTYGRACCVSSFACSHQAAAPTGRATSSLCEQDT